jgi:hypothetical protein
MNLKASMKHRRNLVTVIAIVFALLAHPTIALAENDLGDFLIIPPDAKYRGLTYPEWQARWWQWAFSVPVVNGDHPIFPGGNVLRGQSGRVWFLSAPPVTDGVEVRRITIPAGTALFFPILNAECSTVEGFPFFGSNEAELRSCASGFMDRGFDMAAKIDGVPVRRLQRFRHQSPVFTLGPLPGPLPENNILGLPAGTTGQSVDDGVYLMVVLPEGQHTIRFGGTFDTSDLEGFPPEVSFGVIYRIFVDDDD